MKKKQYVDGKPDYADEFVDNVIFRWDSQIDKKLDGAYMNKVLNTPRKHLFVQKQMQKIIFFIWVSLMFWMHMRKRRKTIEV